VIGLRIAIACIALAAATHAFGWTPHEKPNPQAILDEAMADARAGRYEDALQKHRWFHDNALKLDRSYGGVRNSFALSSWFELARKYPPAAEALVALRAKALEDTRSGKDPAATFGDYAAINRAMGEERATVDAFAALEARDPAAAKRAFRRAEDALINEGKLETVGRYIVPREELELASKSYWAMRSQRRGAPDYDTMVERFFATASGRIVAVLVKLGRKEEADEMHKIAIRVSSSELMKDTLGRALQGELPPPYAPRVMEPLRPAS